MAPQTPGGKRRSPSTGVEGAAAEWEEMFAGGKMPYTEAPFPSVQEVIRQHAPPGPQLAVDVGAGSGRGARWLVRELESRRVVAVEPTASGCEHLQVIAESLAPQSLAVVRATAQGFDWGSVAGQADLVLFDSVLSFIPEHERPGVIAGALGALRPGTGVAVFTSHPDEADPDWVCALLEADSVKVDIVERNRLAPFTMEWEGEKLEAAFAVVVARARPPG